MLANTTFGPQCLASRTHRRSPRLAGDIRPKAVNTSISQQTALVQPQVGVVQPQADYAAIDAQPLNQLVMGLFRRKMVNAIGKDVPSSGYSAIIDLTRKLNSMGGPRVTQMRTVDILVSLFPSWLPGAFKVMFAQTVPGFSCQLNAWATAFTCQWLMGKCEVNDVEIDGGKMGVAHGVKVERCRYLEQAGCAAVCMNSCKVPTQEFFANHMGLPLTMTPNYSDFSCQFAFGKTPGPQATDEAFASPCFAQCPSAKAVSGQQLVVAGQEKPGSPPPPASPNSCSSRCHRVLPMD